MTIWLPRVMWGALVVLLLIQFVPVAKTNPPIETEISPPDAVKTPCATGLRERRAHRGTTGMTTSHDF